MAKLEDIIHMINTSIESNRRRVEGLYQSIFSDIPNTNFIFKADYVAISHVDLSNSDPALVEIIQEKKNFKVSYWDGYSLAEIIYEEDIIKALKLFKRFARKLSKNLKKSWD